MATIESFFGTMLESVTKAHIEHLKTNKYSAHKALEDFYDEDAPDAVDQIIEDYMGVHGKVEPKGCDVEVSGDAIKYFEDLKKYVDETREALIDKEDTEIWSDIDTFLSLIDSTLYKLKELKENMNNLLYESMGNLKPLSSYITEKCKKCGEEEKKKKECTLCEEDIKDEKSFREWAMTVIKKAHPDDFDEDKAKKTIDDLIASKKDDEEWGVLVGKLKN